MEPMHTLLCREERTRTSQASTVKFGQKPKLPAETDCARRRVARKNRIPAWPRSRTWCQALPGASLTLGSRYSKGDMFMPSAITKQPEINAAVVAAERLPGVRYIRYSVAPDWNGQSAIFFRVVLADEASTGERLRDITTQVIWRMSEWLNLPELELFPYFDFRSESEQATLNEPSWAKAS